MRRITQFAALMVVLLLAGQSVLAEAPCSQWLHTGDGHAPACCASAHNAMGDQLTEDCHGSMRSEAFAPVCNQSGCQMAMVQAAAQAITAPKSRADSAASLVATTPLLIVPTSAQPMRSIESAALPGPVKYLLFQVFRI